MSQMNYSNVEKSSLESKIQNADSEIPQTVLEVVNDRHKFQTRKKNSNTNAFANKFISAKSAN